MDRKVDGLVEDFMNDPKFFRQILDGMLEKQAKGKIPKKVEEIADAVRRDTGATDESAYRIAWQTYVKYVNPSYPGATEAGRTGKMVAPIKQPVQSKKAASISFKTFAARDLAEKLATKGVPGPQTPRGMQRIEMKGKKAELVKKGWEEFEIKTAGGQDLAEKLAVLGLLKSVGSHVARGAGRYLRRGWKGLVGLGMMGVGAAGTGYHYGKRRGEAKGWGMGWRERSKAMFHPKGIAPGEELPEAWR